MSRSKKDAVGGHRQVNYTAAPSWWVRMCMTKPQRRETSKLEQDIVKCDVNDLEDIDIPDTKRKPFCYFW